MGKNNVFVIIFAMICSLGFSQNKQYPVKIYIGNVVCKDTMTMSRSQFIKENKLTIVFNEKDTIQKMSFSMQMMKGDNLSEKLFASDANFTSKMKNYIANNKPDAETKKIWIENIKIDYKGELIWLNSTAITLE